MIMNQSDKDYLARAIRLARGNASAGGGPFGAVIVKDGRIIAESANQVTSIPDPTAHAEIQAIRLAAENLKKFDLTGATIYCSCEPCPMCLGAIYWSRICRVVYASDRHDAENAGFRDAVLYRELALTPEQRTIQCEQEDSPEKGLEFSDWMSSEKKLDY
jgi:guanine deaminase